MKKAIFVDGLHEYNYVISENEEGHDVHSLYYSHHNGWSEHIKGTFILSITNSGNDFKLNEKIGKKLQYDFAFELSILLKILSFNDSKVEITDEIKLL